MIAVRSTYRVGGIPPWLALWGLLKLLCPTGLTAQDPPAGQLHLIPVTDLEPRFRLGRAAEVRVRVFDQEGRPVPRASVVFQVRSEGKAEACFERGADTYKTLSDESGFAVAPALTPKGAPGLYRIRITASAPGFSDAIATIMPENVLEIRRLDMTTEGAVSYLCRVPAGQSKISPPAVSVKDEHGQPVVGADVTVAVSDVTAGGGFTGGRYVATTSTDQAGRAVVRGWIPPKSPGHFELLAKACLAELLCTEQVLEGRVIKEGCFPWKAVTFTVLAGGGAGAYSVLQAQRAKGAPAPPRTISITPDPPVFGGPR